LGGEASYALYILQAPMFFWSGVVTDARMDGALFIAGFLCVLLVTSFLVLRYVERPLRGAIVRWGLPRFATVSTA
jgi:peptidoglycan/LPS O-acetylase OafA/YrhL